MNFPVDTRTKENKQFINLSYQQPIQQSLQNSNILDRNYFQMNHKTTNSESLRLHNPTDRLFETSQIYQNFMVEPQNRNFGAEPQNRNFMVEPQNRNFGAEPQSNFQKTRTSKSGDEVLSRVFIDIPHRNYENEVSQRLNGFGIVPKDTRYENDTKSKTNDTANMRTNRSFGTPSNNL